MGRLSKRQVELKYPIHFTVEDGGTKINSIQVHQLTKTVLLFMIDTSEKYPDICIINNSLVSLFSEGNNPNFTYINILGLEKWFGDAQLTITTARARYGCYVSVVKQKNKFNYKNNWYNEDIKKGK